MSRAYTTNTRTIKKRQKKMRTPEETRFMKFFGATDLHNSYANGLDMLSVQDHVMGFQASLNIPLPMAAPLPLDEIPLVSVSEHREIRSSVRESAVPELTGYVVPAIESGAGLKESGHEIERNDAQILVEFLEEMGQKVHEVKALPAGITRITVADLIGAQKGREPELVRAGGR